MSKFEEIGCAKIAFDRADDSAQLNVNLADVGRNEIRAMRQAMNGQDQAGMLPHIDIDVDVDVDVILKGVFVEAVDIQNVSTIVET